MQPAGIPAWKSVHVLIVFSCGTSTRSLRIKVYWTRHLTKWLLRVVLSIGLLSETTQTRHLTVRLRSQPRKPKGSWTDGPRQGLKCGQSKHFQKFPGLRLKAMNLSRCQLPSKPSTCHSCFGRVWKDAEPGLQTSYSTPAPVVAVRTNKTNKTKSSRHDKRKSLASCSGRAGLTGGFAISIPTAIVPGFGDAAEFESEGGCSLLILAQRMKDFVRYKHRNQNNSDLWNEVFSAKILPKSGQILLENLMHSDVNVASLCSPQISEVRGR